MRKSLLTLLAAGFCLSALLGAGLLAAQSPVEKSVKYVNLDLTADKATWNHTNDRAALVGNVILTHGDTIVKASRVDYDKVKETAHAEGTPRITSAQNDLSGDTIDVDLKKKVAVIKGNVKILAKPTAAAATATDATAAVKQSLKDQVKDPVSILCDVVEYYYKEKRMVASGNLKIVQKDRTATAEKAVFTQSDELAILTGNVHVADVKGQTFDAPKVTISLKKGDDWVDAERVKATFKIREEEDVTASPSSPAPAPVTEKVKQ